jgi:hypothetical protein
MKPSYSSNLLGLGIGATWCYTLLTWITEPLLFSKALQSVACVFLLAGLLRPLLAPRWWRSLACWRRGHAPQTVRLARPAYMFDQDQNLQASLELLTVVCARCGRTLPPPKQGGDACPNQETSRP